MGVAVRMAARKNAPIGLDDCRGFAIDIVRSQTPAQVSALSLDEPDTETAERVRWFINNLLDVTAARRAVAIFADIAGRIVLVPEDEDRLVDMVITRIKHGNRMGAPDLIWPEPGALVRQAQALLPGTEATSPQTFRLALLAAAVDWVSEMAPDTGAR